jgi:membrane protein DedA with SNARE-associated domain
MDLVASLGSFITDLMTILETSANDPFIFSIIFFIYAVLTAIILPIPVEVGLFFSPATPDIVKIIIMGLGKMVGSILVFYIGVKVGDNVRRWSSQWGWFNWLVVKSEWLVAKLRYVGLYLILSIPIFPDTVPLYLFSVLNEKGVFKIQWFALVCLLAGMTRATIVYLVFWALGIKLF